MVDRARAGFEVAFVTLAGETVAFVTPSAEAVRELRTDENAHARAVV